MCQAPGKEAGHNKDDPPHTEVQVRALATDAQSLVCWPHPCPVQTRELRCCQFMHIWLGAAHPSVCLHIKTSLSACLVIALCQG